MGLGFHGLSMGFGLTSLLRYTDDTLQILGLHEKQRISGFDHGLKTISLVKFLSTDLPTTYKGLMEKTYTWIEAKEVATNGTPNDHRESFDRSKKNSSWDNNKGKKNIDIFSLYRGSNHGLLFNLSKRPREILATKKVAKTFEQPPCLIGSRWSRNMSKYCHFHEDHGHDTNQCCELKHQINEVVKSGQLAHLVKGIKKGKPKVLDTQIGVKNSSNLVIIKVQVSERQVNRAYMDSGSSCEVNYEHCFLKLKPSIRSLRVDSKVPLVGFSGEHSRLLGKVPLEITIGKSPFARTEVLDFIIVRSDSPHNLLLGRTSMQRMGIVISTIHRAKKFYTPRGVGTIFSMYKPDKIEEGQKKLKEAFQEVTIAMWTLKKGLLSMTSIKNKQSLLENSCQLILRRSCGSLKVKCQRLCMDLRWQDGNSENHHGRRKTLQYRTHAK
ncbi:reverse transcriptase domain-containing protein [Tanacetum coccineum]